MVLAIENRVQNGVGCESTHERPSMIAWGVYFEKTPLKVWRRLCHLPTQCRFQTQGTWFEMSSMPVHLPDARQIVKTGTVNTWV